MSSPAASPERTPRLQRDLTTKAIAGVASGVARHLGVPSMWVRLVLVGLALFNGIGVLVYATLWMLMPGADHQEAPGLEGASRTGRRPEQRMSSIDAGVLFSVGILIGGVLWAVALDASPGAVPMFWPLVLGGFGVVLVWVQADRVGSQLATSAEGRIPRGKALASVTRLVGGMVLVGFGISWIVASQLGWRDLPVVIGAALALLVGLVVVAAPWLLRALTRFRNADRGRLKAEARADMAAHLHDSVLQTLALIQRQANDPAAVASLARRQERELRTWLYGEEVGARSLRGALEQIRVDVEDRFPIAVEVVCVGDLDLDDATTALVHATREAVTNAAKHSGAARVDVYAEVTPDVVEVFIRDRGQGFDESRIRADRMGVRESIRARMKRHGGTARIRTEPGEGTEVRLELQR
ncbi:ATP-binding protein [Arachnia propionica]|uniref:ATP-binding protein n=1 Tax=Arachnia propionica TaxID=1750 RepID=A0A3P1TBQ0_9ACTN|nr:ATP-binding protein [Arachnia propionica]RRD06635.1 ATP-binding protein [Arachnia propionica]